MMPPFMQFIYGAILVVAIINVMWYVSYVRRERERRKRIGILNRIVEDTIDRAYPRSRLFKWPQQFNEERLRKRQVQPREDGEKHRQ